MNGYEKRTHRLTVQVGDNDTVGVICERGDFERNLGTAPTPDQVVQAANDHWGTPLGRSNT